MKPNEITDAPEPQMAAVVDLDAARPQIAQPADGSEGCADGHAGNHGTAGGSLMTPHHIMRTKEALRHGAAEIERLRRESEVLAIKANAFDTFAAFVFLVSPKQYAGSAPDAVWILRKLLAEIEAEEVKAGLAAAPVARV